MQTKKSKAKKNQQNQQNKPKQSTHTHTQKKADLNETKSETTACLLNMVIGMDEDMDWNQMWECENAKEIQNNVSNHITISDIALKNNLIKVYDKKTLKSTIVVSDATIGLTPFIIRMLSRFDMRIWKTQFYTENDLHDLPELRGTDLV